MNLTHYYEMVEECLTDLGIDPKLCRGKKSGQWDLKKGSASVWIDVMEINNSGYFQCIAPVSDIPDNNKLEFYREVLEINHKLYGVGMTKFKDRIYIKTLRETEGLDKSEIIAQINRIANYADDYDDYFKDKYFTKPGRDN